MANRARYLKWLGRQICPDRDRDYSDLYEIMFSTEFIWFIPNDDNRMADGLELRAEYERGPRTLLEGSSVLEVLIALSRRLEFHAGGEATDWAWVLITNLGLDRMSGHIGQIRRERIEEILERLVWRTYEPNGSSGFFPLAYPRLDQRNVELWYQMHAYIEELPELD